MATGAGIREFEAGRGKAVRMGVMTEVTEDATEEEDLLFASYEGTESFTFEAENGSTIRLTAPVLRSTKTLPGEVARGLRMGESNTLPLYGMISPGAMNEFLEPEREGGGER